MLHTDFKITLLIYRRLKQVLKNYGFEKSAFIKKTIGREFWIDIKFILIPSKKLCMSSDRFKKYLLID